MNEPKPLPNLIERLLSGKPTPLEREAGEALASLADELRQARERIGELETAFAAHMARIGELEAAYQELDGDSKAEIDAWIDAEEREQKLKERCAELEKDAARYRWLRDEKSGKFSNGILLQIYHDGWWRTVYGENLDAAIDAAASGPKEKHNLKGDL